MSKISKMLFSVLLLSFTIQLKSKSQVFPKEGSKLNYRLIGFIFPAQNNANHYLLEVSSGRTYSDDSFRKNIVQRIDAATNRVIATVPLFGAEYTWRVVYTIGHSKTIISKFYHFATAYVSEVDTNNIRLRIIEHAKKYKDAYVFLDYHKALYNMDGRPVWFLPKIDSTLNDNYLPRDIKITPQGTITLGIQSKIYEINYNGEILWVPPTKATVSGENDEQFHHEFTRLYNGHYMALGNETVNIFLSDSTGKKGTELKIVAQKDSASQQQQHGWHFYSKNSFATIIEYDKHGNVVWSYKLSKYFNGSDISILKNQDGKLCAKVHENAFYFDENARQLYISLKGLSRVIKIKYPEGTLLNTYGEIYTTNPVKNHCCPTKIIKG